MSSWTVEVRTEPTLPTGSIRYNPMPMGEALARPLAFRKEALAASSRSTMPLDSSSRTRCRTDTRGSARCKASQQLVQPETFLQLSPGQLPVVVLLQQRHELVLPDSAQPGRVLGRQFHEVGRPDHQVPVPLVKGTGERVQQQRRGGVQLPGLQEPEQGPL